MVLSGIGVVFSSEGFGTAGFSGCRTSFTGSVIGGVDTLIGSVYRQLRIELPLLLILGNGRIYKCLHFRVDCFPCKIVTIEYGNGIFDNTSLGVFFLN